jgi:hypothetical protein
MLKWLIRRFGRRVEYIWVPSVWQLRIAAPDVFHISFFLDDYGRLSGSWGWYPPTLRLAVVKEWGFGPYDWDEWGPNPTHSGTGFALGPIRIVWEVPCPF